jgi:hypothetical protein
LLEVARYLISRAVRFAPRAFKDARWTKKNDESFYGYKNHLGVARTCGRAL